MVESSQPPAAESMFLRQQKEATTSVVCCPRGVQFTGTVYICNQGPLSSTWAHCISCEPSACSRCKRRCSAHWQTAQENSFQLCRRSRPLPQIMIISCIYSQLFLLHYFFPSQAPPDTFLERFSDANKVVSIEVFPEELRVQLTWQGFKHNDEEQRTKYRAFNSNSSLYLLPTWTWHTSTGSIKSTPLHQAFSAPTRWPSQALNQTPSPGLWKLCRVSCWKLDTSFAAAWQQRLCLLCLCHWESSTGQGQLLRSQADRSSCPCPMHPTTLVEADNQTLLPVERYLAITNVIAAARSQIMEVPMSPAARIISTTMPDGPAFIWEIAFLTISMVIGVRRPSNDGSSDRWCGSQSNSTLRSL